MTLNLGGRDGSQERGNQSLPRDTNRRPPRSILALLLAVNAHRENVVKSLGSRAT
jgi:hypothetical protein